MIKVFLIFTFLFSGFYLFSQTNEEKFSQELDAYLTSINKTNQPGMAVLVAKPNDHKIFAKGYGLADMVTKTPITPKTVFNLGSVSKTFIALAIVKLQEEGKLSIEDPIIKYFPEFVNPALVKDIKIKHLLSHTSGLPDIRPVDKESEFYLTANDAQNWEPILKNTTLNFQPGEKFEYSNPAYNGLALIIEKLSNLKWQTYVEQIIFKKALMRTSVITDIEFPQLGVAHGYQFSSGQWKEYDFGEYPTFCAAGNGGVWSSVEELLKYQEAIEKNSIISKASIDMSRTIFKPNTWKSNTAPFIGYSWFFIKEGKHTLVGHSGDQAGFRAEHWLIREKNIFIAIISNGSQELSDIRKKTIELLSVNGLL